jgi:hypothetical protein
LTSETASGGASGSKIAERLATSKDQAQELVCIVQGCLMMAKPLLYGAVALLAVPLRVLGIWQFEFADLILV